MLWAKLFAELVSAVGRLVQMYNIYTYKKAGKDEQIVEQVRQENQRNEKANAALTPDNLDRVRNKYTRD